MCGIKIFFNCDKSYFLARLQRIILLGNIQNYFTTDKFFNN